MEFVSRPGGIDGDGGDDQSGIREGSRAESGVAPDVAQFRVVPGGEQVLRRLFPGVREGVYVCVVQCSAVQKDLNYDITSPATCVCPGKAWLNPPTIETRMWTSSPSHSNLYPENEGEVRGG